MNEKTYTSTSFVGPGVFAVGVKKLVFLGVEWLANLGMPPCFTHSTNKDGVFSTEKKELLEFGKIERSCVPL